VTLAYSTYLGGGALDSSLGIAVDSAGAAYVMGETLSTDFPTQDAFQGDQGEEDAFTAKLVFEQPPAAETPPSPEASPSKVTRTISFDAAKAKGSKAGKDPVLAVRKGAKARLSGDVSAPQDATGCEAGQAVELQRKSPKGASFTTFESLQTNASGGFSTSVKVRKTFEYRAVLAETAACEDATSTSEKVKAKKKE
jgi:Beta-propeller repeat